jgi:hypothetical protein
VGSGVPVADGVGEAVGGTYVGDDGGATEIVGPIECALSNVATGNGCGGRPCIAFIMKVCQISAGIVPP